MRAIITSKDISRLARPCYADTELSELSIEQAEYTYLKQGVGDKLFAQLKDDNQKQDDLLLCGGVYIDSCNETKIFAGLKKALAFFSLGLIVRTGSNQQTRFGLIQKEDEYSSRVSYKEKLAESDDCISTGNYYLNECLDYLRDKDSELIDNKKNVSDSRIMFEVLGD